MSDQTEKKSKPPISDGEIENVYDEAERRAVMSSPDAKGHTQSNLVSAIVVATPAVIVYFLGWTYLNYYLGAFGIGIAELDLGVETIFIYSAPAATWLLKTKWPWFVGIAVFWGIVVLWSCHLRGGISPSVTSFLRKFFMFWYVQAIATFIGVTLLTMMIAPIVQKAAVTHVTEMWGRAGIKIRAMVESSESGSDERRDYETCKKRDGLQLVFGDKNGYFMLCTSEIDDMDGVIYEVRRQDSALASVRRVSRPY